jgi:hypothetical protein
MERRQEESSRGVIRLVRREVWSGKGSEERVVARMGVRVVRRRCRATGGLLVVRKGGVWEKGEVGVRWKPIPREEGQIKIQGRDILLWARMGASLGVSCDGRFDVPKTTRHKGEYDLRDANGKRQTAQISLHTT